MNNAANNAMVKGFYFIPTGGRAKECFYLQTIHLNVWTWQLDGFRSDVFF